MTDFKSTQTLAVITTLGSFYSRRYFASFLQLQEHCKQKQKNKTQHNTYPEVKIIKQGVTLSSFKNLVAAVVSAIRDGAWKYLHNAVEQRPA